MNEFMLHDPMKDRLQNAVARIERHIYEYRVLNGKGPNVLIISPDIIKDLSGGMLYRMDKPTTKNHRSTYQGLSIVICHHEVDFIVVSYNENIEHEKM